MIDTRRDMIAAYVVATAIYIGYSISLWVRERRLRARLESVEHADRR